MITKHPGQDGKVRVTFAMPSTIWADSIHVVGDFNNWNERATPLRLSDRGWLVTLNLEPGQSYQYRYLIDGNEWHNDWHADSYARNPYGGDNSVITTPEFDDHGPGLAASDRVINFTARRRRLVPTG